MKLFVVRHGETENNVLRIVQGITDSKLTENGIKAAEKLKTLIKDKKITRIISSPIKRAYLTAQIISGGKLPINVDDRLKERNWGLNEKVSLDKVDRVIYWDYYLNCDDYMIEPIQDFMARIRECLWELKMKYDNENILIVTHSAVSRAIYYCINGIPDDGDMSKMEIPNLGILEYEL